MVKSFIALVTCDFGVELQELLQRVVGGEALDPIVGYAVLGSTLGAFHLWGWETKDKRSKSQLPLDNTLLSPLFVPRRSQPSHFDIYPRASDLVCSAFMNVSRPSGHGLEYH